MNSKIESGIYPGQAFFYGIALPFCFTAGKKKYNLCKWAKMKYHKLNFLSLLIGGLCQKES